MIDTKATRRIRALIVDDEELARQRIRRLLEPEEDVEVVSEADSVSRAVRAIRSADPDLVFLDIRLPDAGGFEVIREVGPERMPAVVFTTAYDEHALRAFEVNAVDYLLKPFDEERFRRGLELARRRFDMESSAERGRHLQSVLETLGKGSGEGETGAGTLGYAGRVVVKSEGSIHFVDVDEIDWIEGAGNYVRLHLSSGGERLVRATLTRLARDLDPDTFVRIHRSTIVNLDRVKKLRHWSSGEYIVELEGGTELKLTRTYREEILGRALG